MSEMFAFNRVVASALILASTASMFILGFGLDGIGFEPEAVIVIIVVVIG